MAGDPRVDWVGSASMLAPSMLIHEQFSGLGGGGGGGGRFSTHFWGFYMFKRRFGGRGSKGDAWPHPHPWGAV